MKNLLLGLILLLGSCTYTEVRPIELAEVFITVELYGEAVNDLTVTIDEVSHKVQTVSGQKKTFKFINVNKDSLYYIDIETDSRNLQTISITVMVNAEVIYSDFEPEYFVRSYSTNGPLR